MWTPAIAEQEKDPGNHYIFIGGSHTSGRMVFLFWGRGVFFQVISEHHKQVYLQGKIRNLSQSCYGNPDLINSLYLSHPPSLFTSFYSPSSPVIPVCLPACPSIFLSRPGRSCLFPFEDGFLDDGHGDPSLTPGLNSPTRCQNGERMERYSRKVFVGGLPPDIDEGKQRIVFHLHLGSLSALPCCRFISILKL